MGQRKYGRPYFVALPLGFRITLNRCVLGHCAQSPRRMHVSNVARSRRYLKTPLKKFSALVVHVVAYSAVSVSASVAPRLLG